MSEDDERITVSRSTSDQYRRLGARYFVDYEERFTGSPLEELESFKKFLEEEINYKYQRSTLNLIKVAIRRILRLNGVDDDLPKLFPIEDGGSQRGTNRHTVSEKIASAMRHEVFYNNVYSDRARLAVMMMYSSIYFGLRPAEWLCAKFVSADSEILVVKNAKYDPIRGKGFGVCRKIIIGDDPALLA